ncbi:MAG: glycosyltransferase family 39 protein [Oscillospiraceae bacterium]|nr:glycosyltransferase family 39 protein [Oscillospiraceae bacterium]
MTMTNLLPIAAVLLIVLFYTALPNLRRCALPRIEPETPGWRKHWFILLLTLLYAVLAFWKLGDRQAPQTLRRFDGESAVITLDKSAAIGRVMLYTGIVQGNYEIEFSPDGETWLPAASFEQGHAALLKWQKLDLKNAPEGEMQALRITGQHGVELCEVAVFDTADQLLPIHSDSAVLCDEQAIVPDKPYYLNSSYFDEIYHARTAWEHLRGMYPYEISHPPFGKILISVGIALFGMTPFGWRFSGTLVGVLMLPLVYWLARRLFGGRAVPGACALLTATDLMHFAQTRIATIDSFAVFFILLMYGFMLGFLQRGSRRDLALSGIFFGFGAASKWTCFYAGAGLGVLWLAYWIRHFVEAQHTANKKGKKKKNEPEISDPSEEFLQNVLFCLLFFVAIPALIYYLSYIPYGIARQTFPFSGEYTKIVWNNQTSMFSYHSGVHSSHPYSSRWYQWVLDIRPILFYLDYFPDGRRSSFGAWLNPILCWAGLLALFVLVYAAIFRRDRKAAFLLVGYLAQLLPWVFITRTTFEYHYFPSSVFLVLALGYVFSLLRDNRKDWRVPVYSLCILSAAVFILFYPAVSGMPVNNASATKLMKWLPTWPF